MRSNRTLVAPPGFVKRERKSEGMATSASFPVSAERGRWPHRASKDARLSTGYGPDGVWKAGLDRRGRRGGGPYPSDAPRHLPQQSWGRKTAAHPTLATAFLSRMRLMPRCRLTGDSHRPYHLPIKWPRRLSCASRCRISRSKCRRPSSPTGEPNCNHGAGGRGNGANWRGCRTANCMTSASAPPSAGRKSTSRAGAADALGNPSLKVRRDHVAPADDCCDPLARVAGRILQDRRNAQRG